MSGLLPDAEVQRALQKLPGWKKNGIAIERNFQFANLVQVTDFLYQIAEAAEAENHHPDIHVSHNNKVTIALVSHDVGGITQRDIRMAGKINELEPLVGARTQMLRRALDDLARSYDVTLEALGDALDLKDAETKDHFKRVTAFTIAIARAMELPHDHIRVISRGAFLHDVGKMAIPDAILRKPDKLTPDEQEIMRRHAQRGYRILHRIPFLRESADIVYSHQERFDGSGYPRGLKGDQIPLGARIFAIADTFDAITSDRPYRAAQSIPAGRREIERCSGRQFDPEIVQFFLSIPEHIWLELRNEI
jgi:putative nucleotidyltransferase with HDIG domain